MSWLLLTSPATGLTTPTSPLHAVTTQLCFPRLLGSLWLSLPVSWLAYSSSPCPIPLPGELNFKLLKLQVSKKPSQVPHVSAGCVLSLLAS